MARRTLELRHAQLTHVQVSTVAPVAVNRKVRRLPPEASSSADARLEGCPIFNYVNDPTLLSLLPCGRSSVPQTLEAATHAYRIPHTAQYNYAFLLFTPYKMGFTVFVEHIHVTIISKLKLKLSLKCRANTGTLQASCADTVAALPGQTPATDTISVEVGEEEAAARPHLSSLPLRPTLRRAWTRQKLSRQSPHPRKLPHWKPSRLKTWNTSHRTIGSIQRSLRW